MCVDWRQIRNWHTFASLFSSPTRQRLLSSENHSAFRFLILACIFAGFVPRCAVRYRGSHLLISVAHATLPSATFPRSENVERNTTCTPGVTRGQEHAERSKGSLFTDSRHWRDQRKRRNGRRSTPRDRNSFISTSWLWMTSILRVTTRWRIFYATTSMVVVRAICHNYWIKSFVESETYLQALEHH